MNISRANFRVCLRAEAEVASQAPAAAKTTSSKTIAPRRTGDLGVDTDVCGGRIDADESSVEKASAIAAEGSGSSISGLTDVVNGRVVGECVGYGLSPSDIFFCRLRVWCRRSNVSNESDPSCRSDTRWSVSSQEKSLARSEAEAA
ncbi:MAG: hypothetical protein AAFN74_27950, partial [Myxococcota bacterium]